MSFVSKNTKKAWRKIGNGRIEMSDYPDTAVLEGVVNALIHNDYADYIHGYEEQIEKYAKAEGTT